MKLFVLEVNPQMNPTKLRCYEELGYLIQMIDDLQDLEEDTEGGISTIANTESGDVLIIDKIKQQYVIVVKSFEDAYPHSDLSYIKNRIKTIMARVGML